ncbi:MAG TPA: glycosyl hydrolase family 65 protein [Acidimicrobiia bacterium]|nr:glycosyl hydrolase family 65 protein [Acidimicrobiia bacterium]
MIVQSAFGEDVWSLTWSGLKELAVLESIFSLSNGFLGVRASFEQGPPAHQPGSLINGFHEVWLITYAEPAYGYATVGQTILYVPDAIGLAYLEGDDPRPLDEAEVERRLDLRRGTVTTRARWPDLELRWERLVSFLYPGVLAIRVEGANPEAQFASGWRYRHDVDDADTVELVFDPRSARTLPTRALSAGDLLTKDDIPQTVFRTVASDLSLSVAVDHEADAQNVSRFDVDELVVIARGSTVEKRVAYVRGAALGAAATVLQGAPDFAGLATQQAEHLAAFWDVAAVKIGADPRLQQAINWNIFQLHQASAHLASTGIPAKGLSGRGYEGHYFWDSEIFVMPFLAHIDPAAAARLIAFRHSILPAARERARILNQKGALFPWRTISGEEASSYYEAGTAQYHINADIVYGVNTYLHATDDYQILIDYGVEIAVETARLWADLGHFEGDSFHFSTVTGPDEYSALVDDNAYTNLMARFNLTRAVEWTRWLEAHHPDEFFRLSQATELDTGEIDSWQRLAGAVFIPQDDGRKLTPQDARFLHRKAWDWTVPRSQHPLLLFFHPLVIYRHQVLKQADVVMAMYLLPHLFSEELTRNNFDFYDPLTTRDSSLSAPIQAAVAARIGYLKPALSYFEEAALLDLENRAGNTADGLHLATAGGTWQTLVSGFGGFTHGPAGPQFDPRLPPTWSDLEFNVRIRGSLVHASLDQGSLTLTLLAGQPVRVSVGAEEATITSGGKRFGVAGKWI